MIEREFATQASRASVCGSIASDAEPMALVSYQQDVHWPTVAMGFAAGAIGGFVGAFGLLACAVLLGVQ
jgi:hypothetical protein